MHAAAPRDLHAATPRDLHAAAPRDLHAAAPRDVRAAASPAGAVAPGSLAVGLTDGALPASLLAQAGEGGLPPLAMLGLVAVISFLAFRWVFRRRSRRDQHTDDEHRRDDE